MLPKSNKDENKEVAFTLQQEKANHNRIIREEFGWFFLAKDVADYTNSNMKEVIEKWEAITVFGYARILQAKNSLNA